MKPLKLVLMATLLVVSANLAAAQPAAGEAGPAKYRVRLDGAPRVEIDPAAPSAAKSLWQGLVTR